MILRKQRKELPMPGECTTRIEAEGYIEQLHDCFVVWMSAMQILQHDITTQLTRSDIIAAIGPIAQARRELSQSTVAAPMQAAHRAALALLQSAMDALDALAAGHSTPAVQDLSEQLTIFQVELVLFAERAGLLQDRASISE
jgi:hypothetical protein